MPFTFYALWLLPPQIQSTHSFTLFLYFSVRASSFYFSSLFFLCPFGECKSLKVALLFVFSPLEGKNDPKTSSRLLIVDRTAVTLKHLPFLHIIPLDSSFLAFWQIPKQWAKQEQQQNLYSCRLGDNCQCFCQCEQRLWRCALVSLHVCMKISFSAALRARKRQMVHSQSETAKRIWLSDSAWRLRLRRQWMPPLTFWPHTPVTMR